MLKKLRLFLFVCEAPSRRPGSKSLVQTRFRTLENTTQRTTTPLAASCKWFVCTHAPSSQQSTITASHQRLTHSAFPAAIPCTEVHRSTLYTPSQLGDGLEPQNPVQGEMAIKTNAMTCLSLPSHPSTHIGMHLHVFKMPVTGRLSTHANLDALCINTPHARLRLRHQRAL